MNNQRVDNRNLLKQILKSKSGHVHLVGVCGVGMAGLAFHLRNQGFRVTGCDIACNHFAPWLESCDVSVACNHDSAHLADVDWVIRSTAVRETHPEIAEAFASGIPVFLRGMVLSVLLSEWRSILVCGTHGKTTTAWMIVQTLRSCGVPPCFCIGGESDELGHVAGIGKSGIMVVEADESDGTLAYYQPDIAVITNIEFDHAEHFENLDAFRNCFETMIRHVKKRVVFCADDAQSWQLCKGLEKAFSYGFSPSADLRATDIMEEVHGLNTFRVSLHGKVLGSIRLPVPGRHNILNALAACAAALEQKAVVPDIQKALSGFVPVRRRFERVVEQDDVLVISDYAHHPSEVAALLRTAKRIKRSRWIAVFQPHRFSRTKVLGKDFPSAFEGVDELILAPVYAASEEPIPGGTVWDLYARFRANGKIKTVCASSLCQVWKYLKGVLKKGDGLLVIGAGDVEKIALWARDDIQAGGLNLLNPISQWMEGLSGLGLQSSSVHIRHPLFSKTTLRVGGCADILLNIGDEDDLAKIVKWSSDNQVPVTILGAGSNVLVSDLGVRGVVLLLDGIPFKGVRINGDNRVVAGAGVALNELTSWLADQGKSGLEFLKGIPGSVGGALRMNAGAGGETIGGYVAWVRVLNSDAVIQVLEKQDLQFGYRQCETVRNRVIIEVALNAETSTPDAVRKRINAIAARRAWMRGMRSAGSVFKNPEGDTAGRLIEQAGLKARQVGGARVSERHANMIVTEQNALASDVAALIGIIRNEVKTRFGVELVEEIICLE